MWHAACDTVDREVRVTKQHTVLKHAAAVAGPNDFVSAILVFVDSLPEFGGGCVRRSSYDKVETERHATLHAIASIGNGNLWKLGAQELSVSFSCTPS